MTRFLYWYQGICPCDLGHNWNWPSSGAFVFHKQILFYNYIVDVFHHLRILHSYLKNNVKCIKFFFDKQKVLNYRTASLAD